MLNKAERLKILKIFRIWSLSGLLPFQVDLDNRRLNVSSKWKQFISVLSYILFVLHTLYKNGSLVYAFFFVPDVQLHQLVMHAVLAIASAMCVFWYYVAYVRNPTLFLAYVNITVLGNTGGPNDPKDALEMKWTTRMPEYSMQDLIALSSPYMCMLASLMISVSCVYDPSMVLLLYATIPARLQNWATFGLCLLEEIRFLLLFNAIATPIWQMQVISFDLVSDQLRLMKQAVENGTQRVRSAYEALRCLQLYTAMLNNVNSYLIFTWKFASISIGILSGYAAVAHFREYPVFGIMYYVNLIDCVILYTVIYEKAFVIPELFGQGAACVLLRMRGERRGILRRQIMSIPRTGVKVGDFHKMERASTLIYMDFVLTNIVNMLVAYG